MPRLDGMNPILLKTLISLAASNNKSAKSGSIGDDAQLRSRTILYPEEALDLPEWGIAGIPGMILGAAPQTCLFVSDLQTSNAQDGMTDDDNADPASPTDTDNARQSDGSEGEIASFSLTLVCTPGPESNLKSCTIIWKLALPISGYRDVQTSSSSPSVRAPVIKTRMKIRGIEQNVEIGLLEMSGLEQPLLIGQDTLGDKFLIRPDRDKQEKPAPTPSVNLNPAQSSRTTGNDSAKQNSNIDSNVPVDNSTPNQPTVPSGDVSSSPVPQVTSNATPEEVPPQPESDPSPSASGDKTVEPPAPIQQSSASTQDPQPAPTNDTVTPGDHTPLIEENNADQPPVDPQPAPAKQSPAPD